MTYYTLNNGLQIPAIGLGTYPLYGQQLCETVDFAYSFGYRLIDTADNYYNELDLGESLKSLYNKHHAKRADLFLVTKLSDELYNPKQLGGGANKGMYFWKNSPYMQTPDAVRKIIEKKIRNSLKCLNTDYIDLLLMHWPYPDYLNEIWYEMEEYVFKGVVKSIGVCNCRERHLRQIFDNCRLAPSVNQMETSPVNTKKTIVDFCKEMGVKIMVYSPLMSLRFTQCDGYQDILNELAGKYNKSTSQIILRFDIQRGLIPIPKSTHPSRLQSNIDVFSFDISKEDMQKLENCNMNLQTLPESKSCPGL